MIKRVYWLVGVYLIALIAYAVFSYSLTAPNLILSSSSLFWDFQTWMWKTFFNDRQLLSTMYVGLMIVLFSIYSLIVKNIKTIEISKKVVVSTVIACALPLLVANNALSYDVFNYIFNAKMVSVYQANPHLQVALDFAYDDWTRFMHNTHTPAPYGYGWTALSLIPFSLGMGKFTLTWLLFRLFSFVSLLLLLRVLLTYTPTKQRWWIMAILLNPLVLIEIITNTHNDLWMMTPAVLSLSMVSRQTASWKHVIPSLMLLVASITIKLATVVLLPMWLVLTWQRVGGWVPSFARSFLAWINKQWALLAAVAMFSLLLTNRSQQFHPWYLTWVLAWIPLMSATVLQWSFLLLSASSMMRYLPYLAKGEYTPEILAQQKMITWLPWLFGTLCLVVWHMVKAKHGKSQHK